MARGEAIREAPVPVPGELVPDNSLVRIHVILSWTQIGRFGL